MFILVLFAFEHGGFCVSGTGQGDEGKKARICKAQSLSIIKEHHMYVPPPSPPLNVCVCVFCLVCSFCFAVSEMAGLLVGVPWLLML